jgi:polyisoprenoid-binding protein YceI
MTDATLTPAQNGATTTWQIDPAHSHVEFAVKHLMMSTVRGRFSDVSGTVTTDGTIAGSQLAVRIAAGSIDTRQAQRDQHLVSADFLDVATYPDITFVSTKITPKGDDEFTITGDLTIHGVTREVTLDATREGQGVDPWGNERAGFSATGKIDRRDFGLTYNQALETGGFLVGNELKLTIDAQLTRAS